MNPEEKPLRSASSELGIRKGTKRTNDKKLKVIEEKVMKFFAKEISSDALLPNICHIDPRNWKYDSGISEINLRLRKWFIAEDPPWKSLALDKGNMKSLFRRAKASKMQENLGGAAIDITVVRAALPKTNGFKRGSEPCGIVKDEPSTGIYLDGFYTSPPPNLGDGGTIALLDELQTLVV